MSSLSQASNDPDNLVTHKLPLVATVISCPYGYVGWLPDVNSSVDMK